MQPGGGRTPAAAALLPFLPTRLEATPAAAILESAALSQFAPRSRSQSAAGTRSASRGGRARGTPTGGAALAQGQGRAELRKASSPTCPPGSPAPAGTRAQGSCLFSWRGGFTDRLWCRRDAVSLTPARSLKPEVRGWRCRHNSAPACTSQSLPGFLEGLEARPSISWASQASLGLSSASIRLKLRADVRLHESWFFL